MKTLITISFCLFFSIAAFSQQSQKKNVKPKNLTEAVAALQQMHKDSLKKEIAQMSEREFSAAAHFGLGMWIRNNWRLWKGGELKDYFNSIGIFHPDDMSGIILTSYHRELNKKDWKVDEQVKYYQDYWKRQQDAKKIPGNDSTHKN